MNPTSSAQEMKLKISLNDPRAIEIVESISSDKRDEVIEKYIILGEMVASHASIATSKETVEDFFEPLRNDIEMMRNQLELIIPTAAKPVKKGEITEDAIFQSLQEHFMDDSFEDVSDTDKYSDILATTNTKTDVLIELKDYVDTVDTSKVNKFWRDLERRDVRYGIFVSMRSGIAKCSGSINIKTEMNRTAVFVVNCDLNWSGHIFAFQIIKKLSEIESIKNKELKGKEIAKVITKINNQCKILQKHVQSIDNISRIADSLKTTSVKRLDELIDISNKSKRSLNDQIEEIIEEIKNIEL